MDTPPFRKHDRQGKRIRSHFGSPTFSNFCCVISLQNLLLQNQKLKLQVMKFGKITLLLVILSLFFTISSQAQKKKLLRFKLEKGSVYEMVMNMNNNMDQEMMGQQVKMDQQMEMITIMTVEDVLPNNNFLINYHYKSIKMDMDVMGNSMTFDSENEEESTSSLKALKNLTKTKLKLEFTPLGKVISIDGFDSFNDVFAENFELKEMFKMISSEKAFKSSFGQTFNYFPEEKVTVGDSWSTSQKIEEPMSMNIDMHFTVSDIQKHNVFLDMDSDIDSNTTMEQNGMSIDMEMKGKQNGTLTINSKDGMLNASAMKQDLSILMKMKNPQTNEDIEMPIKMHATIKTTVSKK